MCGPLARAHRRARASSSHRILSIDELIANPGLARPVGVCEEHAQLYRFFDKDCNCLVCQDCGLLRHRNHELQSIPDAIKACQEAIEPGVATAKQRAHTLSYADAQVNAALTALRDETKKQEAKLDEYFHEVSGRRRAATPERFLVAQAASRDSVRCASALSERRVHC
jgi:hypothetical protein